jgi:hypothetical protein
MREINVLQAAWRVLKSPSPDRRRLYQNAADRFFGCILTPILGNTVEPPFSGASNYLNRF